ncbi:MAG: ATP-dependent DNA ligase [Planctomycetota bacterium]
MKRFTELYDALDSTTKTGEKAALLEAYFRGSDDADAAVALFFLLGHRVKRTATTKLMRTLASRVSEMPAWMVDECYGAVGDLSETVALLVPGDEVGSEEDLSTVFRGRVLPLASVDESGKERLLLDAWRSMNARERFVYHKLIRGGFRVGVQAKMVSRALAAVAGVDSGVMAGRLAGYASYEAAAYRALLEADGDGARDGPYPMFLARSIEPDVEPAVKLGDIGDWWAEWKWDGIRCQLLRRDGVALWSRGEELVTDQFPEIAAAATRLPRGSVLDGELLAWQGGGIADGGRPRSFGALQRRLNRKGGTAAQIGLFEQHGVCFVAYDALEIDGEDVRNHTLVDRREMLERTLSAIDPDEPIDLSPRVEAASWDALAAMRAESRDRGVEGLMLKRLSSRYGVGRTDPTGEHIWWKWKVDPYSVDAVLVYAQLGSGRRASLLTDYTFAVWDGPPEKEDRTLTPFAKAYSGLTQDEIEKVDAILRKRTSRRRGPMREVTPTLVFEIGFEGIRRSDRHKSGVAVRFPRMLRWRKDKRPEEADTISDVEALLPLDER